MTKKYTFSFTGASALIAETLIIAEEYEKHKNWQDVRKAAQEKNLLNKVKGATFEREFREIKKRLSLLTTAQLHILLNGMLDDTKAMILLALAKTYSFFGDFIIEVIRSKFLSFDSTLSETDYNKFYNVKIISHPELSNITEKTARKVKQVIFKLVEQVGLITRAKNGVIVKPLLREDIVYAIVIDDLSLLLLFLYSNEEIKTISQKYNDVRTSKI